MAPPSYEEALSTRMVTSLRLASQQHHSSALPGTSSGGPGGQIRSLSEDRATSHPSPPPPFRGRNSSGSNLRPLTRSSRVEEIPDIYWEQAARELDFCTCRKCQVGCFISLLWDTKGYTYCILTYIYFEQSPRRSVWQATRQFRPTGGCNPSN